MLAAHLLEGVLHVARGDRLAVLPACVIQHETVGQAVVADVDRFRQQRIGHSLGVDAHQALIQNAADGAGFAVRSEVAGQVGGVFLDREHGGATHLRLRVLRRCGACQREGGDAHSKDQASADPRAGIPQRTSATQANQRFVCRDFLNICRGRDAENPFQAFRSVLKYRFIPHRRFSSFALMTASVRARNLG